jgi:hypothetical protein
LGLGFQGVEELSRLFDGDLPGRHHAQDGLAFFVRHSYHH